MSLDISNKKIYNETVISLILPTVGRIKEVDQFLNSILTQDYNLDKVEIIVIDQNSDDALDSIIKKYVNLLRVIHIKSSVKGISKNRNVALKISSGRIFAFPDDDCLYYPNTLASIVAQFDTSTEFRVILGRIFDKAKQKNIIRKWPKNKKAVSIFNFFAMHSSVTIFTNKKFFFDERLGVGSKFGACEDSDLVYSFLKMKVPMLYNPEIEIWHPEPIISENKEKIENYGMGFGGFTKKHSDLTTISLFIFVILYHFIYLILGAILFNRNKVSTSFLKIISRVKGFSLFSKD